MKFAVIEYKSKTGTVWRHTPERPNYLANPQTEIDTTSFGCYVSALAGEHVPLTGLILGPVAPILRGQQFARRLYRKIRGHWPTYSLSYLSGFDVLLFVHQLSDTRELINAMRRIRTQYPQIVILGVSTHAFGILHEKVQSDATARQNLIDFMNTCHVFLTIAKEKTEWYQELATTPVRYVPQPYPTEYASKAFVDRAQKAPQLLVAGITQRDNITKGHLVARRLQEIFPHYDILVPKVADLEYDDSRLKGSRYTVLPFEDWQQHLTTLAHVSLVINTDYGYTRGRVQVDCAAVGTPNLGSNSDGQRDLWPELYWGPEASIDALVEQARRVLTDSTYYDSLVAFARTQLPIYSYATAAERLTSLVKEIRQGSPLRT